MGGHIVLLAGGSLSAALAVVTVRASNGLSLADPGPWGVAFLLVPGVAAIVVGAGVARREATRLDGRLLTLIGVGWFAAEWAAPGSPSPLAFTAGLAVGAAAAAPAAQLVLSRSGSQERGPGRAVTVAAGYIILIGLCGVVPTLYFSPASNGCTTCPPNLLLLADDPGAAATSAALGAWLGVTWAILAIVAILMSFRSWTPEMRGATIAILLAGIGIIGFAALGLAPSAVLGGYRDEFRNAQGLALLLLACAIAWAQVRSARAHRRLVRLVLGLDDGVQPVDLAAAIGNWLGDPGLSIAYPVGEGRYANQAGVPVPLLPPAGRTTTVLHQGGEPLAVITHRVGLLNASTQIGELLSAARLGLVNERLRARRAAQLAELRVSRLRLVEAADDERRRLERDLHDGVQQQMVSLALALREPIRVDSTGHASAAADAVAKAASALRELARGIYPAALAQGLRPALEALAESTGIALASVPDERLPPVIETTAYQVANWAASSGAQSLRVDVADTATTIRIKFTGDPRPLDQFPAALADRVHSVGGAIARPESAWPATLTVTLPSDVDSILR